MLRPVPAEWRAVCCRWSRVECLDWPLPLSQPSHGPIKSNVVRIWPHHDIESWKRSLGSIGLH